MTKDPYFHFPALLTSLLVLINQSVCLSHLFVMAMLSVLMVLMNLAPFVGLLLPHLLASPRVPCTITTY